MITRDILPGSSTSSLIYVIATTRIYLLALRVGFAHSLASADLYFSIYNYALSDWFMLEEDIRIVKPKHNPTNGSYLK